MSPVIFLRQTSKVLTLTSSLMIAAVALADTGSTPGQGSLASLIGVTPTDIATVQSFSLFGTGAQAAIYNPAKLAEHKNSIIMNYSYTDPALEVSGERISNYRNRYLTFGINLDLSRIWDGERAVNLGIILGGDDNMGSLLEFDAGGYATVDVTPVDPIAAAKYGTNQSLRYGGKPLSLAVGAGFEVSDHLSLGLGVIINMDIQADIHADLTADIELPPNLGINLDPPDNLALNAEVPTGISLTAGIDWVDEHFEAALSWRQAQATTVGMGLYVPAMYLPSGLQVASDQLINIPFMIDDYSPEATTLAGKFNITEALTMALSAEYQAWSGLDAEFQKDFTYQDAGLEFDDIIIPRLGMQYQLNPRYSLNVGYAYAPSPLDTSSLDQGENGNGVRLFDLDEQQLGLGLDIAFTDFFKSGGDLNMGIAYQYRWMKSATYTLATYDHTFADRNVYMPPVDYAASGSVQIITAGMSIKW